MLSELDGRIVARRLIDGLREAGVLLATFAPLDAALASQDGNAGAAGLLFSLGILCFCSAIYVEARYVRSA